MTLLTTRRRADALLTALLLTCGAAGARAQNLSFTPYHANGLYAPGEKVGWKVAVAKGDKAAAGPYTYTIKRDGQAVLATGSLDMKSGKGLIETTLPDPGMVLVEVRPPAGTTGFHGASKAEVDRVLLGAAVAPTGIKPSEPKPADFDSFWTARIAQLQAVPMNAVLTPGESGVPGVEYYTIRMDNINGAHIYGQLARPAGAGKYPAMLMMQWASPPYPLQKDWITGHAAKGWLVLNVEPHDVPGNMAPEFYANLPALIKNYNMIGRLDRDESYFLPMYLGDYRAVEYLAGRPDWDGKTLVATGTSMGGQQGFAVTGLNPKVTAMMIEVPAGADVTGPLHGRMAPYPNWDLTDPRILKTARYFDSVNFAYHIRVPSLIALGYIDEACPPAGIYAAYNLIQAPKEAAPMITSPHNHMATPEQLLPWTERSAAWFDALVHGQQPWAPAPAARAAASTK